MESESSLGDLPDTKTPTEAYTAQAVPEAERQNPHNALLLKMGSTWLTRYRVLTSWDRKLAIKVGLKS